MKLTAAGIARIAAAVVAAGISSAAGAVYAHSEHRDQLEQVILRLEAMAVDVRLLKCAADFPGDCPGQATRTAAHK